MGAGVAAAVAGVVNDEGLATRPRPGDRLAAVRAGMYRSAYG